MYGMEFETDRLLFRWPRVSDAADFFQFLGDSDAMRYTQRLASLRACRRHIAAHRCQRRKVGCGPWTVLDKRDRRIIGIGGLYEDPYDTGWGVEVGYHFTPSAWGNGFATELTRLCLGVARDRLGLAEVRAFAHPDNTASRRVLMKAEFEEVRFVPEMERFLYRRSLVLPARS
jgi:ribosomal-protein-alanine N-acetyltransferase